IVLFFFFQAEDGIRDFHVTGVQTCALPIYSGGIVIAQARETVPAGTLDARTVKVPGVLIDVVVLAPDQRLSADTSRDPGLTGGEIGRASCRERAQVWGVGV